MDSGWCTTNTTDTDKHIESIGKVLDAGRNGSISE